MQECSQLQPMSSFASRSPIPPSYPALGKFNSVLNAGLCAAFAVSPPLSAGSKGSLTLSEMLSNDQGIQSKLLGCHGAAQKQNNVTSLRPAPAFEKQHCVHEVAGSNLPTGNSGRLLYETESSDVKLTLRKKDGRTISLNLHRRVLIEKSKFFATKLSETWSKQHVSPHLIELTDCDDFEIYRYTLQLLYCKELKPKLLKCSLSKVLEVLKVSALLLFESCITACMEYLEAVPWSEEEEEKVRAVLGRLQLDSFVVADVLRRLHREDDINSEEILVQLLQMIIRSKDEKARREMKSLVSRLLRENMGRNRGGIDLSKESLYVVCRTCLDALLHLFIQATKADFVKPCNEGRGILASQITQQADNLLWLLEILIDRHIADDFVKIWSLQSELASLHKQIAVLLKYEVSHLTARLCVAIGKGEVLCPLDVRYLLLQTWLPPLMDDFGWMYKRGKGLNKNLVEEGISQSILTLSLKQQQSILLAWFERFTDNGDDCPNLQQAFEVWWRRTFVRPYLEPSGLLSSTENPKHNS